MKLGMGIGWRPELARWIECQPGLGFVEVIAEDLEPAQPAPVLQNLRGRGVQVIPHGVSLSLGGAEPLSFRKVEALAALARELNAPLVSEHVAFVRAGGVETGHLLPLSRNDASLELVCQNVRAVQQRLSVPLALENVAHLFEWPGAQMPEVEFFAELLDRTGALLLLDLANIHANTRNHGGDPIAWLEGLPLDRLAYVHVAGGLERDGLYHDTHAHAVPRPVLELLEELARRIPIPGVLLERDDHFPGEDELETEMQRLAEAVQRGDRARERNHAHHQKV